MMNYILDYLADHGAAAGSLEEEERIEDGIRLYLKENGIDTDETRPYFRKYVDRHLGRIPSVDLRDYFSYYTLMSEIRQIVIEYDHDRAVSEDRKTRLYDLITELHSSEIGDKYIPVDVIKEILGTYA